MKTTHIFAIVGPSGSGKTTISKFMRLVGIPDVISYTTRPMRQSETNGVEHNFISEDAANCLLSVTQPLAYTEIAGYRYFSLFSQLTLCDICTYVIDETGLRMMHDKVAEVNELHPGMFEITTIYVDRDKSQIAATIDAERIARDKERIPLAESDYDIHIVNDAQNLSALKEWSFGFATALRAILPLHIAVNKQVRFYTSEPEIHRMINLLNPSYDEAK